MKASIQSPIKSKDVQMRLGVVVIEARRESGHEKETMGNGAWGQKRGESGKHPSLEQGDSKERTLLRLSHIGEYSKPGHVPYSKASS